MLVGFTEMNNPDSKIEKLQDGVADCACGLLLGKLDSLHRCNLYTALAMERLNRKSHEVKLIYDSCDKDWNQTLYVMLFRAMGGSTNQKPFKKLADKVRYNMCLRERNSLVSVEAMLLGTSGLIFGEYYDDYIVRLNSEYDYLRSKYQIGPAMYVGEWDLWRVTPANNPILRIVQLASLVAYKDFIFDNMLTCRTCEDIHKLFDAEASEYWTTHYSLAGRSIPVPKRLGNTKKDILGINVVVPVMFAYADYVGNEKLEVKAVELLENIPAEKNMIINKWAGMGVCAMNAFDTQALLQLNNEYCAKRRCAECRICKKIMDKE